LLPRVDLAAGAFPPPPPGRAYGANGVYATPKSCGRMYEGGITASHESCAATHTNIDTSTPPPWVGPAAKQVTPTRSRSEPSFASSMAPMSSSCLLRPHPLHKYTWLLCSIPCCHLSAWHHHTLLPLQHSPSHPPEAPKRPHHSLDGTQLQQQRETLAAAVLAACHPVSESGRGSRGVRLLV
jgi:hypothetical protein